MLPSQNLSKLMYTVDEPDPHFGNMLLEQFGGANGELAAAMHGDTGSTRPPYHRSSTTQ